MFLLANEYMFMVEANRVVLYYGRVGSYKTLSAVATAYHLLKTGRYKRCYANIPVSFASSPPVEPEDFDFLSFEYASDSIFIIDESALFLTGRHEQVKEIFAFPRKINQVFLLASVLPTKQIRDYGHLFVSRGYNLPVIGLPLVQFTSTTEFKSANKKNYISHWMFRPSGYYYKYSSKFRPSSLYPIMQYRDTGALYDPQSRDVPEPIRQYFDLDGWGQAIQKRRLPDEAIDLIDHYLPTYDTVDVTNDEFPRPKIRKSWRNIISGEFRLSFLAQLLFIIYITYCIIQFIGHSRAEGVPMSEWHQCEYISVLKGHDIYECSIQKIPTQKNSPTYTPTATPQVVEFTIQ